MTPSGTVVAKPPCPEGREEREPKQQQPKEEPQEEPEAEDEQDYEETQVDVDAVAWVRERAGAELARLREARVNPLLLATKNYGVIVGTSHHGRPILINRIELDTAFDFERRVKQILVAPPEAYPHKEHFAYCHVILLTGNMKMPLLVPYLYPTRVTPEAESEPEDAASSPAPVQGGDGSSPKRPLKNDLKHWLFINAAGARARHSVEGGFHDI